MPASRKVFLVTLPFIDITKLLSGFLSTISSEVVTFKGDGRGALRHVCCVIRATKPWKKADLEAEIRHQLGLESDEDESESEKIVIGTASSFQEAIHSASKQGRVVNFFLQYGSEGSTTTTTTMKSSSSSPNEASKQTTSPEKPGEVLLNSENESEKDEDESNQRKRLKKNVETDCSQLLDLEDILQSTKQEKNTSPKGNDSRETKSAGKCPPAPSKPKPERKPKPKASTFSAARIERIRKKLTFLQEELSDLNSKACLLNCNEGKEAIPGSPSFNKS